LQTIEGQLEDKYRDLPVRSDRPQKGDLLHIQATSALRVAVRVEELTERQARVADLQAQLSAKTVNLRLAPSSVDFYEARLSRTPLPSRKFPVLPSIQDCPFC
jgi:hypothetical protein